MHKKEIPPPAKSSPDKETKLPIAHVLPMKRVSPGKAELVKIPTVKKQKTTSTTLGVAPDQTALLTKSTVKNQKTTDVVTEETEVISNSTEKNQQKATSATSDVVVIDSDVKNEVISIDDESDNDDLEIIEVQPR